MRFKFKALIRKAIPRKKNDQLDRPNDIKQNTIVTAPVTPKTGTGQRHSEPQNSKSTRRDENLFQLSRKPVRKSSGQNGVARVSGSPSTRPGIEDIDRSVAQDYESYLPAISPVENHNHTDQLNSQNITQSRGEGWTNINNTHNEDAFGDASFDSTLLNLSSRPDSRPSASSASSAYSQSLKDLAKVQDEQKKSLKDQRISDFGNDTAHFDGHSMQLQDAKGLLHRVSTNSNTVGAEHQSITDEQTRVPRGFDLTKINGLVDLKDSVDIDKKTRVAPAVQHETVKPKEHEIVEERIYREIHNHDVYHRILPIHDVEILPARHFVHDSHGDLTEVSGDPFPHLGGIEKRWEIVKKKQDPAELIPQRPRQTQPKVIADEIYMTEEGYPRRETTILHPPELEDLTGYDGPVMPIIFSHSSPEAPEQTQPGGEKSYDSLPSEKSPWLRELMDGLSGIMNESDSSSSVNQPVTSAIAMR